MTRPPYSFAMTRRLGSTGGRATCALLCLGIALISGAGVIGCIGGGDDNASPPIPSDAGHDGATDGASGDATRDGGTTEGGDAGSSDAGTQDGGTQDGGTQDGSSDTGARSGDGGRAIAVFSSSAAIDFAAVGCGAAPATKTLNINNSGSGPLAVSAMVTSGTTFTVSPLVLSVAPGTSGTLTLTATVPSSTAANTAVKGSLNVFTSDPSNANVSIPLSVTPTGASLALSNGSTISTTGQITFASTEPGTPTMPQTFTVVNQGNAPATFSLAASSDMRFSVSPDSSGGVMLNPGGSWAGTATFLPKDTNPAGVTLAVTTTGATCGASLSSIRLSGQGAVGQVQGWPTATPPATQAVIDFGAALCNGKAPAAQTFTLTNVGSIDAHLSALKVLAPDQGFTVSSSGRRIPSGNGTVDITVTAPAVPTPASGSPAIDITKPITATLSVQTDAETSPHSITLQEEPSGAILAFDTSPTTSFGTFGSVVLLQQSAPQAFNVTNTGNAAANVTLVASTNGPPDAGTDSGEAGADGSVDATIDATPDATVAQVPQPFAVAPPTVTVQPGVPQAEQVTFSPVVANANVAQLYMTVDPTTSLCAVLQPPLPLTGTGIGAGVSISQTSLSFPTTCGGAAPDSQAIIITNNGTADLTWAMTSVAGPGAANYAAAANPAPGLLIPGASATVTVTAAKIASPAPTTDPSALAAQVTITTDVPYDVAHVVSFAQIPVGDQLSVSVGNLSFGQIPINTSTIAQTFSVTNNASSASPGATFSLNVQGAGAGAYTVNPSTVSSLAPSAVSSEGVTFLPTSGIAYPATLALSTSDNLCTPLPPPIPLSGTGTQGAVSLSAKTLAFGTDPKDPAGLVNCGATGPAQNLTVTNVGNQAFNVTGATLGLGASSPYVVSGATLPAAVPIGGSVTLTVTPNAIPQNVANPNDASPFTDTLTVTTSIIGDSHLVSLVMQARGAVIANTPLTTAWSFGTIVLGSIGTFTSTIQNTGNAPASVALNGLTQPTIFSQQNNPTTVAANGVTSLVGQFVPPMADGSWTDQGTLVVTTGQAFCEPLPTAWASPTINLAGASNGNPPVVVAGDLSFPTTQCASAAPASRAVTLTNTTNQTYPLALTFNSGKYYSVTSMTDAGTASGSGSWILPASGTAVVVVTPTTITPGPGVLPGAAPYADDLLIRVGTGPLISFTIPVTWRLDGAVLSLPQGTGPSTDSMGNAFYPADSTSGFALPMDNSGTAAATVDFTIQPVGAWTFSPTPPISVLPGIRALPQLNAASSDPACPNATSGQVTFLYSGPVCQPFQVPKVAVHSCSGTF